MNAPTEITFVLKTLRDALVAAGVAEPAINAKSNAKFKDALLAYAGFKPATRDVDLRAWAKANVMLSASATPQLKNSASPSAMPKAKSETKSEAKSAKR